MRLREAASCGLAAMISDTMRLPLTFGLSGALHAAALYGFVPPAPPTGPQSLTLQVRLLDGRPVQAAGPTTAGLTDSRIPQIRPIDRHASVAPADHVPATTPAVEAPVEAVATPITEVAPLSEIARAQVRQDEPLDSAALSPAGKSRLPPPAHASAAISSDMPGSSGTDPFEAPDGSAGTLAAPYQAPKALHSPAPEYPEEARWEKRTGQATLGFRVEEDGSVAEIRMLHSSGHTDLDAAAMESLRHWRFALPRGGPPAAWYRYLFRFELT